MYLEISIIYALCYTYTRMASYVPYGTEKVKCHLLTLVHAIGKDIPSEIF